MKKMKYVLPIALLQACVLEKAKDAKINASLSASEISSGESLTLKWDVSNAKSCTLKTLTGLKDIPLSGAETFTPTEDETYTIRCDAKKPKEISLPLKVYALAKPSLSVSSAQIYLGQTTDLAWSCAGAEGAEFLVDGEAVSEDGLELTGATTYAPEADVTYSLRCLNKLGKASSAEVKVTVIPELDVKLSFTSLEELQASVDITKLLEDCGPACVFKPFDEARFSEGEPTKEFIDEVTSLASPLRPRSMLVKGKSLAFDLSRSFGYGHRQGIDEKAMKSRCESSWPLDEKGTIFPSQPDLTGSFEQGTEEQPKEALGYPLASELEISTRAIRGVALADTPATLSYRISDVEISRTAAYTDYDHATGGYKLLPTGELIEERSHVRANVPLPANGYSLGKVERPSEIDNIISEPSYGYLGISTMPNPSQEACSNKVPYVQYCEQNFCTWHKVKTVDQKNGWQKFSSPRVVSGSGTIQCSQFFKAEAAALSLGANWVAQGDLQYFVTDPRFKAGCSGADCASKEPRTSETDWRFEEVEPAQNRCIDRWKGLSWSGYLQSLQTSCQSTPLYAEAKAKYVQGQADEAFASACKDNSVCEKAVKAMKDVSQAFSVKALSDLLELYEGEMKAAKSAGLSYFIGEAKLSPESIAKAKENLSAIKAGLDSVQALHTAKKSNWMTANRIIHGQGNVQGYDSFAESKETNDSYQKLIARAEALTALDLQKIGCSYEAEGRFRGYDEITESLLSFPVRRQETHKTKILQDTKVD